ncbi:MAG TPA: hypothetical protein VHW09_19330 [Bryobacteraceae bacterium]|jgi:hypothetical protein|nr:hypothetical protein [Bryobacteraceae bacterium]
MRSILLLAFLPAAMAAAPALAIVRPVIAQSDGGDGLPAAFKHVAGETLFFSCNISGFTKSAQNQINVAYSVQAFDPKGIPVGQIYKNESKEEVGPQDKDWMPKIEDQVVLPDILQPGSYKIVVKAEDLIAKTSADLTVPFEVNGRDVKSSPTLIAKDFRWYHNDGEERALNPPLYHPGDNMFMKFDITGYKYGANNKVDISYVASLVLEDGKTIWTQPEPALEQSESYYPRPYVEGEFGISLNKDFKPGTYTMAVDVKDAAGKQNYQGKFQFTVQ